MPFSVKAKIVENNKVDPGFFKLTIFSPESAGEVQPGQFFHLQVSDGGYDPLLRRPFSVYDLNRPAGTFSILYRVIGLGTEILSRRLPGDELQILGPLGRPFTLWEEDRKVLLVAGGAGIAPLYFLVKELLKKDIMVEVFLGAGKAEELAGLKDLQALKKVKLELATEDGSAGYAGRVTQLMEEKLKFMSKNILPLKNNLKDISFDRLYSCGPRPMLKEVVKIARAYGLKGEISLEEVMACGVGACLGCVFPVKTDSHKTGYPENAHLNADHLKTWHPKSGQQETVYRRVCAEGPTFSLEEVF